MKKWSTLAFLACSFASNAYAQSRTRLLPELSPGQTILYRLNVRSSRDIKTESRMAMPPYPSESKSQSIGILQVEILDRSSAGVRIRTNFRSLTTDTAFGKPDKSNSGNGATQRIPVDENPVTLLLQSDGSAAQISGLDKLVPEAQEAWRQWFARFAAAYAFPQPGIKVGQKWETEENETAPSPLDRLIWQRASQYVRDEPCSSVSLDLNGPRAGTTANQELCAVILTHAQLKQKSNPKDATPQDYKLRNLRTSGSATGTNETILYISLSTHLLVRSTDDADQSMDVTIALTDGSNQVHYTMKATSKSALQLVSSTPFSPSP